MPEVKVGVVGGTGLYDIEGLTDVEEIDLDTPFGKPSDSIVVCKLEGADIAFLPRHGKGHRILPNEIPTRANIYALKSLGVEHIIAICSAGSFKKEIKPGDLVIPDQLIDRVRNRVNTFFGDGIVAHISFAEPFCPVLSEIVYQVAQEVGASVHKGGTYVTMEGPAFSTRAESQLYRSWGADIIGMTALPEAKLAREAEICYAVVGCVTDYDSWWERREPVTVDIILDTLHKNVDIARRIIKLAAGRIPEKRQCDCITALDGAIVTDPQYIPAEQRERLDLLISKYIEDCKA